MKIEIMEIPRYVIAGQNATEQMPQVFSNAKIGKKGLIITGKNKTRKIAENKVIPNLKGVTDVEICKITHKVNYNILNDIFEEVKNQKFDFVVSVGGGSIIDAGKVISSWINVPFISYPTSPAHDGISSPAISFLLREEIKKHNRERAKVIRSPLMIIADADIIANAPYRLFAAGFGDMIAKFTAVMDWRLAQRLRNEDYSEYAAAMSLMSAKIVYKNRKIIAGGGVAAARILIKALIGSGVSMSIAGSSRPASGAEHLFSHAIDLLSQKYEFKPALHGEQCGVGAIVSAYLHGLNWKKIQKALREVRAPTNAKELGIKSEYIIEALTIAHTIRKNRYTILGDRGINRDAAEAALRATEIID